MEVRIGKYGPGLFAKNDIEPKTSLITLRLVFKVAPLLVSQSQYQRLFENLFLKWRSDHDWKSVWSFRGGGYAIGWYHGWNWLISFILGYRKWVNFWKPIARWPQIRFVFLERKGKLSKYWSYISILPDSYPTVIEGRFSNWCSRQRLLRSLSVDPMLT